MMFLSSQHVELPAADAEQPGARAVGAGGRHHTRRAVRCGPRPVRRAAAGARRGRGAPATGVGAARGLPAGAGRAHGGAGRGAGPWLRAGATRRSGGGVGVLAGARARPLGGDARTAGQPGGDLAGCDGADRLHGHRDRPARLRRGRGGYRAGRRRLARASRAAAQRSRVVLPARRARRPAARTSAAGIGVPEHGRHAHTTELINAGVSIEVVRRRLGHASTETTQLYTLLADDVADTEIRAARRRRDRR
ncbi:tyrosine-type recombinase/integrase [Nonomuraea sp. NPDC003754]